MLAHVLAAAALALPASQAQQQLSIRPFAQGLSALTAVASTPAEPRRLYAVEQVGRIRYFVNGKLRGTFLDIRNKISSGGEQGLLSVAFHPNYAKNHRFYVNYTDRNGNTRVVEFRSRNGRAITSSARQLLFVHQPFANHNGGEVVFGPDGMLYIGLGDGGSEDDPRNYGQNLASPLSKILRIDPAPVGTAAYTIPTDNPFVKRAGAFRETWMWGLRNPWRFSFDRATGDTWIGDVGQNLYEEIDFARAGNGSGANWGWSRREGFHAYKGAPPAGARDPIVEESHADGWCAIVGGYVYRGQAIPKLDGVYLFGDNCHAGIEGLVEHNGQALSQRAMGLGVDGLTSFGQDDRGELYVVARGGTISKIVAA